MAWAAEPSFTISSPPEVNLCAFELYLNCSIPKSMLKGVTPLEGCIY